MTADLAEDTFDRVNLLYRRQQFEECRVLCEQALDVDPRNFDAMYLLALALERLGKTDIARTTLDRAIALQPAVLRFDFVNWGQQREQLTEWVRWERRFHAFRQFARTPCFVISYPKCGRTWLRAMLGHYLLRGRPGDPLAIDTITLADPELPAIDFSADDRPQHKRFDAIETDKSIYRDKIVVLLARDPRDVVVSNFFQFTKRGGRKRSADDSFTGSISDFARYPVGGLPNVVGFYNAWARQRHVPRRYHLTTYESLRGDTLGELKRLVAALGLPDHGPAAHDAAIAFGSFENMRRIEEAGVLANPRLRNPRRNDPEAYKVRKGRVGGYRDYLGAEDIAWIDDYLARELDDYFAVYKRPGGVRAPTPV